MKAALRILGLAVLSAALVSCSKPGANYEVLQKKAVKCPEGFELTYEPWGESGLQSICVLRHGPTVIAEYGRIQIEGQYDMGKKVGEWRWFDESGKVIRTEKCESGKP